MIFERTAALTQWPLHWQVPRRHRSPRWGSEENGHLGGGDEGHQQTAATEHLAASCLVFIHREEAMKNMSQTFEYLIQLSEDTKFMNERLRCIAKVGFQMQYSMPRKYDTVPNSARPRDAVDVILDHFLL